MVQDGAGVEQRLRGVLMRAVAGIHDGHEQVSRQEVRRSRGGMPHDDGVGPHGRQRVERIHQRFALGDAGAGGGDGDGIGAQTLGGDLETGTGAGGGFEEKIDDHLSAKRVELLRGVSLDRLKILRAGQNGLDLGTVEVFDSEQSGGHGSGGFA